ncbi:MATE family efflux transporter [Clostridium grantii]|uniref:Multidrug export protein MepA n=1 Tax=Clostridium grantii DSM 8605 TaxID=1121316 RepID=A0A1M5V7H8_9CLOT|nr:MATE family efflux transporter [Clostridium grantii]SHH71088.1 putative efflux protein, MATE family [Clostridium grantii DSM 8605]
MEKNSRAKLLGEEKVTKALFKLSVPAIVGMMINAIYNVVDTFFVGKLNSTSATGAVAVAFPIFMLIGGVGLTFGMGGGSYISRLLGEKKKQTADKVASTTLFTSLAVGIIFTILGVIFLEPLLKAFGSTETILVYAKDYTRILIFGSVFTVMNMTQNNIIRAEGNPLYSMIGMSVGAILNMILDPIFMFVFNMGITGAALATVFAQGISFIFLSSYFIRKKSYVEISLNNITITKHIYGEIMKIGIPTFVRQTLSSVSISLINIAAAPYGDSAVASMGIVLRIVSLGMFVIFGYNQGFQPLAGFNYGAKNFERLHKAVRISLKFTTVFSTCIALVFIVFANPIINIFSSDSEVIAIGVTALRAICIFFPTFGFQNVYATLYVALGKGLGALILSMSRQGIFLIPAILIMPKLFNIKGVLFAQTVADLCTIIVTIILASLITRTLIEEEETYRNIEN